MQNNPRYTGPIHVAHLTELVQKTPVILDRINATPNGGRLFLADPLRLLSDVAVILTPQAARSLQETLGYTADNPLRHLYDDFKQDTADTQNPITINGIIPNASHYKTKHGAEPGATHA